MKTRALLVVAAAVACLMSVAPPAHASGVVKDLAYRPGTSDVQEVKGKSKAQRKLERHQRRAQHRDRGTSKNRAKSKGRSAQKNRGSQRKQADRNRGSSRNRAHNDRRSRNNRKAQRNNGHRRHAGHNRSRGHSRKAHRSHSGGKRYGSRSNRHSYTPGYASRYRSHSYKRGHHHGYRYGHKYKRHHNRYSYGHKRYKHSYYKPSSYRAVYGGSGYSYKYGARYRRYGYVGYCPTSYSYRYYPSYGYYPRYGVSTYYGYGSGYPAKVVIDPITPDRDPSIDQADPSIDAYRQWQREMDALGEGDPAVEAWALLGEGESRVALTVFSRLCESDPESPSLKSGYAMASLALGDERVALWALRRMLRSTQDHPGFLIPPVFGLAERLDGLAEDLRFELENEGGSSDRWLLLAGVELLRKDDAAALAAAEVAERSGDRSEGLRRLKQLTQP